MAPRSSARRLPSSTPRSRREGLVFVSAGAGTGKTSVLVERFARAIDAGRRRRLDPRHHLHRARGRRAALADPRAARRARPARADPRARRRLDLDDPRLLPATAQAVPVRGRARPALPRARREPGGGAPGRGVRRGAGRVLPRRCARAARRSSRRTARRLSGGCSPASTRRCAPPAGRSSSRSATLRRSTLRVAELRARAAAPRCRSSSSCSTAGRRPSRSSTSPASRSRATTTTSRRARRSSRRR